MKKSLNDLIETVKELDGYREQSLAILGYLKSNGVVCKEKIKISEDAEDLCALAGCSLDEYYWRFDLKDPTCDRYYDSQVVGSICVKNMCTNILQAVKEEKIDLVGEELYQFVSEFISLINVIFPEGQGDNLNVYLHQGEDFGLSFNPNRDTPSLYQIRIYRSELFTALIKTLMCRKNISVAINIFKQYSSKYDLKFRSLLVSIPALNALDNLSDFDLRYLLAGIDAEQTNAVSRKDAYLKTVKKLYDSGCKLKSPISHINEALLKEISDLSDTHRLKNLNQEQRYYLSILVLEYDEFKSLSSKKHYEKRLTDLRDIIEKNLIDIENAYEEKLLADFNKGENKFNKDKKKELFIDFLKTCEKCKTNGYKDYVKFSYDIIDYENLYEKVKKNDAIISRVAAAQYRFSKLENLDLGEGDFTNLVAVQIKVIERYLKEIIAQNMVGKIIYSAYEFETKHPKNKAKNFVIGKNNSAENLSSSTDISIELATAGFIISNIGWKSCSAGTDENKYFYEKRESSFSNWREKTRNGYFHIHPVKNMDKVREIHYKTAFCLTRCIFLLKPLTR